VFDVTCNNPSGGSVDVYVINADGTGRARLTNGQSNQPDWSPDGSKIAFKGNGGLYTMNPDGSGPTKVPNTGSPTFAVCCAKWSPDGRQLLFGRLDQVWDLYKISLDGTGLTRLTTGVNQSTATWSPDGQKIAFFDRRGLVVMNTDGSGQTVVSTTVTPSFSELSWQPILRNYARPRGATPTVVSLSPAYKPCASPNTTHAAPLAFPSCNPPQPTSSFLTVGTPDFNGQGARSVGSVRFDVVLGPPEDGLINVSITDVRCSQGTSTGCGGALSPYTGALGFNTTFRITDKSNGGANPSGTVTDLPLAFSVPCAPAGAGIGSTCSVSTTINTVVGASAITAGKRAIWELGSGMKLFDGGSTGVAGAPDATLFADGSLFFP
jgi:hypothetical protein